MKLLRIPGVHRPVSDTWLLAEEMHREGLSGARVADICTGTGALAISAARGGASSVDAVDLTRRAVLCARVNAIINGVRVDVRQGDLCAPLAGRKFDVIVSNPPYIPANTDELPTRASAIPLDAGRSGRALLDRLCRQAPVHLAPAGVILIVHSSICGVEQTVEKLEQAGIRAEVVVQRAGPLGPVMKERAPMMRRRGLLGEDDVENIVVIRGMRTT